MNSSHLYGHFLPTYLPSIHVGKSISPMGLMGYAGWFRYPPTRNKALITSLGTSRCFIIDNHLAIFHPYANSEMVFSDSSEIRLFHRTWAFFPVYFEALLYPSYMARSCHHVWKNCTCLWVSWHIQTKILPKKKDLRNKFQNFRSSRSFPRHLGHSMTSAE